MVTVLQIALERYLEAVENASNEEGSWLRIIDLLLSHGARVNVGIVLIALNLRNEGHPDLFDLIARYTPRGSIFPDCAASA